MFRRVAACREPVQRSSQLISRAVNFFSKSLVKEANSVERKIVAGDCHQKRGGMAGVEREAGVNEYNSGVRRGDRPTYVGER